jgi:hypothetical protein
MPIKFKRRLFLYVASGAAICVAAQIAILFCFFTYQWFGQFVYLPFYWLSSWPNILVQPFFPKTLPRWLDGMGWPINCFISLVGWVTLGAIIAFVVHGVLSLRRNERDES